MKCLHLFLLVTLALSACSQDPLKSVPQLAATMTPTPTTDPGVLCGENFYMTWASHPLEELSAQVQGSITDAGITGVSASAAAYGEDWYHSETGEKCNFSTMQTDFTIKLFVASLEDREAMGLLLGDVLAVMQGFPPEETPGPQPGLVIVQFKTDLESQWLQFSLSSAQHALEQRLQGAELVDFLIGSP